VLDEDRNNLLSRLEYIVSHLLIKWLIRIVYRTSSNQNTRQNQVDDESEENAFPGDLRHGINSPSKHYSVR